MKDLCINYLPEEQVLLIEHSPNSYDVRILRIPDTSEEDLVKIATYLLALNDCAKVYRKYGR